MQLDPEIVRQAALRAADMLSGMGYLEDYGGRYLLSVSPRRSKLTTALQSLTAWEITKLDPRWSVCKASGIRPFLVSVDGSAAQLRVTSSKRRPVHKIMALAGIYIVVRYSAAVAEGKTTVNINEIRMGDVGPGDWICTGKPVRAFSSRKSGGD